MPTNLSADQPSLQATKEVLAPIRALIRERIGLTFDGTTEEKLRKSLLARIHATHKPSFTSYHQFLRSDAQEFQNLTELLTINETFFYREPSQLDLLTQDLIPMVREGDNPFTKVKIMSMGCSTGEEAYSLAIALWEAFGSQASKQFQIVAGDLDKVALAKAENGQYGSFSFRGVPAHIKEEYFDKCTEVRYHVKAHIKEMVTFHPFNLLSDDFAPIFSDIDIMFYRNVSIYFDEETRKGIIERINMLLRPNGFMVMGSAETLANDFGVMQLTSKKFSFFFSKQKLEEKSPSPKLLTPIPPLLILKKANSQPSRLNTARQEHVKTEVQVPLKPQKKLSKPDLRCDGELDQALKDEDWDEASRLLVSIQGLTEKEKNLYSGFIALYRREFDDAKSYAEKALVEDEWSLDAQIILGLTSKYQESFQEATVAFKRAIYLQKDLWLAHYYLADCLRQLGQNQQALRSYSLVMEVITSNNNAQPIQESILSLPFHISINQVRFLCELHMNTLKDKTHGN